VSTNTPMEDDVRSSLEYDPRIPDAQKIAVSAVDGVVTLRGTVERFTQRRAAVADARKIDGVSDVIDKLKVHPLLGSELTSPDDAIRGQALQMLIWDIEVPSDRIDVQVYDGWVTLKGEVDYQFQSDDAFEDVARLGGVTGVTNKIRVVTPE
jgi:osmotically-inducible protein OsmY